MCGIAGFVGPSPPPGAVERMVDRLHHRGPDDRGLWRGSGVELGHTRLAILDLSDAGHQPMSHGPYTITYNGEVYNFRELRNRLDGPFESDCDTEVVLRLLAEEGASCLRRLRGMFAFALWDADRRRLFAARDRLGIKPLYYRELDGGLAFASEIKALLELGTPSIDRSALRDYLGYRYIPPPKTAYAGIRQLEPAHWLTWDGSLETGSYWSPPDDRRINDIDEASEELEELLGRIVPMHTLADVPVGVFLSGGIDSTATVAYVSSPTTFTLASEVTHRDEAPTARRIATHFGADHHEETAAAVELDVALDAMPRMFDEPFADTGSWATYLVARLARRHVKVALCGEGGDELFYGYQWYRRWDESRYPGVHRLLANAAPTFSRLGRSLQRRAADGIERYAAFLCPFTPVQKRALLGPELKEPDYDDLWFFRRHWRDDLEPLRRLQWADLHTFLPGDLLTRVDRASMFHSLELRPPLLDHELVEFALSLDPSLQIEPDGRGKLLLRRVLEARVPRDHLNRPKRGFNLPVRRWVQRRPELMTEVMSRLRDAGLIRLPRRPALTNEQVWLLLTLDRWLTRRGGL